MDLYAIRRRQLRKLIDEHFNGVSVRFAEAMGWQPTDVARYFVGGKHGRNISERKARHIERKLPKLGAYWMDQERAASPSIQQPLAIYKVDPKTQDKLLELFDGLTNEQQEEIILQIQAFHATNQAVLKQLGGRGTVSRKRAAEKLPPAPHLKVKA